MDVHYSIHGRTARLSWPRRGTAQERSSQPQFWGQGNWGKNKLGRGSCLGYYAYRKIIAAKIVFVRRFLGGAKHKLGVPALTHPMATCLARQRIQI